MSPKVVLGDREFCSVQLANWLGEENVDFCLRLKENTSFLKDGKFVLLNQQGLKPGTSLFSKTIKVTRKTKIKGFNVVAKWKKPYRQITVKEAWYILTSLKDKDEAIKAYKKRFDIEEMFRNFKGGGYNLEETKVRGKRLESLILVTCFAYFQATLIGQKIDKKGGAKYLGRIKEIGKRNRRHSSFYLGLYCCDWVPLIDKCWETVQKIMKINPGKLPNYLRGIRAMEPIVSTF
ncbi:MAG: IS4 family transposase [Cyanobacteriota bacterium]|nr:IS4 family transposase [Cyanobacteriota bacterium]